ncbi:MAG: mannose-1-phosphate guanylyltransferase [bacterium]
MKNKKRKTDRKNDIFAVILAGGSGTRLWPMSRRLLPKQFLSLGGKASLLQATIARLKPLVKNSRVIVMTNRLHSSDSCRSRLKNFRTITEPAGRNTAPAIGLAAVYALKLGKDPVLLALPADHTIRNVSRFLKIIRSAVKDAQKGRIVTLGIVPDRPETGYGYMEAENRPRMNGPAVKVRKFTEKPDVAAARRYLNSGRHFWNSGMFVFRASVILKEIRRNIPGAGRLLDVMAEKAFRNGRINHGALNRIFPRMPFISIDYGVMEKSPLVYMIPCDIGWSDVGSWFYLHRISEKDRKNNVILGDVMARDCENSLVYSSKRMIAAIGLRNMAVVETPDAIMVCPLERTQEVKEIVDYLKKKRSELC